MTDDTMRRQIGMILLRWALQILPEWTFEKKALVQCLAEYRAYDRYRALTMLLEKPVVPFHAWRRDWQSANRFRTRKRTQFELDLETEIQRGLARANSMSLDNAMAKRMEAAKQFVSVGVGR